MDCTILDTILKYSFFSNQGSILSPGVPLALSQDHAYEQTGDVADSNKSSIEPDPSVRLINFILKSNFKL